MRTRIAVLITTLIVLPVLASGCSSGFPDRQAAADAVVAKLHAGSGVESVHQNYVNSIDRGASFEVTVEVDRGIAGSALADVGRQFVESVDGGEFADHLLSLAIGFPLAGPGSQPTSRSAASFRLTDDVGKRIKDMTADQIATDLRFWIQVVNFPGVTSVDLQRPAQQSGRDARTRLLYAHVVDANAGAALETRYPELQHHWQT